MGAVHQETLSQGRGCHEFDNLNFNDINTIKTLIKNRSLYDEFQYMKKYESTNPFESNGTPVFHEMIEVLYLDLEYLIENCGLNDNQKYILDKLMLGWDEKDIASVLECTERSVFYALDTICNKIKEYNQITYAIWLETSGNVKIPDKVKYKQCSKCGDWLRADNKYFNRHPNTSDGFQSRCKNCNK